MFHPVLAVALSAVLFSTMVDRLEAAACPATTSSVFFEKTSSDEIARCLSSVDEDGFTPLMTAAMRGRAEEVAGILDWSDAHPSDSDKPLSTDLLSAVDREGFSVIHLAAQTSTDPRTIVQLVSRGANPTALYEGKSQLEKGSTTLHIAARRPDGAPIVAVLLALGATDGEDESGRTAADLAKALGERGNDSLVLLEPQGYRISRAPEMQKRLFAESTEADCSTFLTQTFFETANARQVAACALTAVPFATTVNGDTALHLASAHASDPDVIDAVMLSIDDEDTRAQILGQSNAKMMTPLHVAAARASNPMILARLVAWGGDPNVLMNKMERRLRQDLGTAPLHFVASRSDPEREGVAAVLLALGADPTLQDRHGYTPLHRVMLSKPDRWMTTLLLQSERSRSGNVLQRFRLRSEISQLGLLDGAAPQDVNGDVNLGIHGGATPLHLAAGANAGRAVIGELLRYFDASDRNARGESPLMIYARYGTDPEIFELLLQDATERCEAAQDGSTIPGLLQLNDKLKASDISGRTLMPLGAFKKVCP